MSAGVNVNVSYSMIEPASSFRILSTLRYDHDLEDVISSSQSSLDRTGPFYMLQYHRNRLLEAARYFRLSACILHLDGPHGMTWLSESIMRSIPAGLELGHYYRVRITLDAQCHAEVAMMPASRLSFETLFPDSALLNAHLKTDRKQEHMDRVQSIWSVYLDKAVTEPSPVTSFKTTDRHLYDAARARIGIESYLVPEEVLMHNPRGLVMDASLTSVYFYRNGQWVTPDRTSGGQLGTTRRWALDRGVCIEGIIRVESLIDGEHLWLSNGVKGFIPGKYRLSRAAKLSTSG